MKISTRVYPISLAMFLSLPAISAFAGGPTPPNSRPPQMQGQGVNPGTAQTGPSVFTQVVKNEDAHKERLKEEKKTSTSRASGWGPRVWFKKMKHKWGKDSEWTENKKQIEQSLGGYETSMHVYNITTCSANLMEKHYADIASFKLGASYLKDMQNIMLSWNTMRNQALQEIDAKCKKSRDGYKLEKNAKKIERTKVFSDEQRHELDGFLDTMFSGTPGIIPLLQKAYDSTLDCHNPKGMTLGVAFGLGGYGGMYRQKCKSPLGQRYTRVMIHGGPSIGFGGVATMSFLGLNYSRDLKEANHSRPFHARFDGNVAGAFIAGYGIDGTLSGGSIAKAGQTDEQRSQNISEPTFTAAPATGAGIYAGVGAELDYRTNTNKPDFDPLFRGLGLYK